MDLADKTLLDNLRVAIRQLDEKVAETDPAFMGASILLASTLLGADEAAIAAALDYEPEFVDQLGSRLRNSGIWTGRDISDDHRDAWEAESGGIAFWMDVSVANGNMVVSHRENGQARYAMSPAGIRKVEAMLRK